MLHPLLVLFGSETGNAQDIAETIAVEASRRHFRPRLAPADRYALENLPSFPNEPLVVFVVSTTGQGEPPDNIKSFWRFLRRKSLAADALKGMRAAVFGLGDSAYVKYNLMAKLLYRRLESLGARMLLSEPGLGDDQAPGGADAALDEWLPRLFQALRSVIPLPPGLEEPPPTDRASTLEPKYQVEYILGDSDSLEITRYFRKTREDLKAAFGDVGEDYVAHAEAIAAAAAIDRLDATRIETMRPRNPKYRGDACKSQHYEVLEENILDHHHAILQALEGMPTLVNANAPYGQDRPCPARVSMNRRVTSKDHFQDVRIIELEFLKPHDRMQHTEETVEGFHGSSMQPLECRDATNDAQVTYSPGDVISVWPRQYEGDGDAKGVAEIFSRCDLDPNSWVRVTGMNASSGAPAVLSRLGALLTGFLDLTSAPPRRSFIKALANVCPEGRYKERLEYFSSAAGRDDFYEYCTRERKSVLEILRDFPTVKPTLEILLSYAPRLRPRKFSAASSQSFLPGKAQILMAVASWTTASNRSRRGLCSSWLASLPVGSIVPVWAERGALKMPPNHNIPMILIGPGTGVAPFRSFLQERLACVHNQSRKAPCAMVKSSDRDPGHTISTSHTFVAPSVLFFGCRNERMDYYCREEWEGVMVCAGVLGNFLGDSSSENGASQAGMITAFSRDQEDKIYVTHRIREHGEQLWSLIENHAAYIFVAGNADRMPADVAMALKDVARHHGGMAEAEAQQWLRRLEASGRYQVETWA